MAREAKKKSMTKSAPRRRARSERAPAADGRGVPSVPSERSSVPARAVIDAVRPNVDGGCFPVKRIVGERVDVEADVIADGHDRLGCELRWRPAASATWHAQRMREDHNDVWRGRWEPVSLEPWEFLVEAWVDPFLTWAHDLRRRLDAGQDVATDLEIGASIVDDHAESCPDADDAAALRAWAERLRDGEAGTTRLRAEAALGEDLDLLMWKTAPRRHATRSLPIRVDVDRPLARFSAWYEMFPRSAASVPGRHGTFADVERLVPYVADMGFDILYLPPIHPIGRTKRKGPNNTPQAGPDDPGSPWAVGGPEGGHTAIHPDLGTFEDFDRLVETARRAGLEIALDVAFQCSPDHPWVTEHPEWFRHRPDGSIQYAENPPKKYEDIYPFDFECAEHEALEAALQGVFEFWIERGVTVFRVDNPHTKPFRLWDRIIGSIRATHPEIIFLSEAFTRPKKMYRLAKGGFTQSYTYFAWRNGPDELRAYVEELATPPVCDLMRPSFWPNTPDILTEYLQHGGRPGAMARLVLAATLSPSYGIYGPVFELCDFRPRPGAEENLDNEKYEIRHWNRDDPWSLAEFIGLVNRIRRENPALQQLRDVTFHHADDPAHLCYAKRSAEGRNVILCVVNTNPHEPRAGMVRLDLGVLGLPADRPYVVHDLLTDVRYEWHGADNFVGLDAGQAHVFRVEGAGRDEHDFETWV